MLSTYIVEVAEPLVTLVDAPEDRRRRMNEARRNRTRHARRLH